MHLYFVWFYVFRNNIFFDTAKNEIYDIYWSNELKCRKYTKRICCYILWHCQVFVAAFFYPIYCIYAGKLDTSKWPLPFNMVVPFDTTTIQGWYLMWFIQINSAITYCLSVISTTSYFVACCLYIVATCDHFNFLIRSIEANIKESLGEKNSDKRVIIRRNIKEKLINVIQHHTDILE